MPDIHVYICDTFQTAVATMIILGTSYTIYTCTHVFTYMYTLKTPYIENSLHWSPMGHAFVAVRERWLINRDDHK